MAENGKKLISFIGSLIGTFLAVTYAIYQLVYSPLNLALATECDKREDADQKLAKEINLGIKEQMVTNQQILIMLAELKAEMKVKR